MFLVRAFTSFGRCLGLIHLLTCGRRWPGGECITNAWSDCRQPFRIIHCFAAARMLLNGVTLCLQYNYPTSALCNRGNEQLFFRGCVRATGIPIHLLRGFLKPGILFDTEFERLPVETFANFTRAFFLIPISSFSLFHQWYTTVTPYEILEKNKEETQANKI